MDWDKLPRVDWDKHPRLEKTLDVLTGVYAVAAFVVVAIIVTVMVVGILAWARDNAAAQNCADQGGVWTNHVCEAPAGG